MLKHLVFLTWYQNLYEYPILLLINILNMCHCVHQNLGSSICVHFLVEQTIPLHPKCYFQLETLLISLEKFSILPSYGIFLSDPEV
jgi:hypothetical protein